jgi:hypothetical protein
MNQKDERLEKVEQITINWETFKKALKRNYLDPDYEYERQDRTFVLRLYPPFEAQMEVEYYESRQGRHYNNEWEEKPFHIRPEIILLEVCDINRLRWNEYPTETNTRHALSGEVVEENDIEELVQEGREVFWSDLRYSLPNTFNLGRVHGFGSYPVEINWEFEES